MPIVEYMLHKTKDGLIAPDFVERHLGYFNSSDNTYLGYVKPASTRRYYVPSTVKQLTKEQFIEREYSNQPTSLEEYDEEGNVTSSVEYTAEQITENTGKIYDDILARFGE